RWCTPAEVLRSSAGLPSVSPTFPDRGKESPCCNRRERNATPALCVLCHCEHRCPRPASRLADRQHVSPAPQCCSSGFALQTRTHRDARSSLVKSPPPPWWCG